MRTFIFAGDLENEATAAKNHIDFEVVKRMILP